MTPDKRIFCRGVMYRQRSAELAEVVSMENVGFWRCVGRPGLGRTLLPSGSDLDCPQ